MQIINNEKLRKFEEDCIFSAKEEAKQLEINISCEIKEKLRDKVEEYKAKRIKNFNKENEKLNKQYNSDIFKIENEAKIQILNKKKELKEELNKEVKTKLEEFVNSSEYYNFLDKNIEEAINSTYQNNELKNNNIIVHITQKDTERYGDKLKEKYLLETIDEKYIGGSICVNNETKISVDNTILSILEEKINNN